MRNHMKKILLLVGLFITCVFQAQNVAINGTGAAPDASAMLDVASSDRGFLPPRVALTAVNAAGPITAPATGLLVYNTATAGTSPNDVVPGYYFWDGVKWVRFISNTFLNSPAVSAIGKYYSSLSWTGTWGNGAALTFLINDPNIVYGAQASQLSVTLLGGTDAIIRGLAIRNVRVKQAGQFEVTVVNNSGGGITGSVGIAYVAYY